MVAITDEMSLLLLSTGSMDVMMCLLRSIMFVEMIYQFRSNNTWAIDISGPHWNSYSRVSLLVFAPLWVLGGWGTTILLDDDDLNFSLALHERLMERKVRQQKQNWTTITPTGQYVLWLCWMGETVGW